MTDSLEHLDQRDLRVQRDAAITRMKFAAYAAFAHAGLAAAVVLFIAVDSGAWLLVAFLLAPAVEAALGYAVLQRSLPAAVMLFAVFAATVAYQWVGLGRPTNLLVVGGLAFVLFNGIRSAIDYPDLDRELTRRRANDMLASLPPA